MALWQNGHQRAADPASNSVSLLGLIGTKLLYISFNSHRPGGTQVQGHEEGLNSPQILTGSPVLALISDFLQPNQRSSS